MWLKETTGFQRLLVPRPVTVLESLVPWMVLLDHLFWELLKELRNLRGRQYAAN